MYQRERHILVNGINETIRKAVEGINCYILGGCITSIFTGRKINDYDLYFASPADKDLLVERLTALETEYIKYKDMDLKSKREVEIKPVKAKLCFNSDNSQSWVIDGQKLQLIQNEKFFGTPQEIWEYFDFTINMGAYRFKEDDFVFHPDFFVHNSQRRLVFHHRTEFPIVSLTRVFKYQSYGYTITKSELILICLTIASLRLDKYHDIKRQLMGIDTLFLKPLTDWLGQRGEEKFDLNEFMKNFREIVYKIIGADDDNFSYEELSYNEIQPETPPLPIPLFTG